MTNVGKMAHVGTITHVFTSLGVTSQKGATDDSGGGVWWQHIVGIIVWLSPTLLGNCTHSVFSCCVTRQSCSMWLTLLFRTLHRYLSHHCQASAPKKSGAGCLAQPLRGFCCWLLGRTECFFLRPSVCRYFTFLYFELREVVLVALF